MRNIMQYPITYEEKINAVTAAISTEEVRLASGDAPVGDITLAALWAVLGDLLREALTS